MSTVTSIRQPVADYLGALLADHAQLPTSPLARINSLRAEAVHRLDDLELPTVRDEAWRFTDIAELTKQSFKPARSATSLDVADVAHLYIEEARTRLVFVDGTYAPQLSSVETDSGLVASNLPTVFTTHAAAIDAHLGHLVTFRDEVFAALNTAFLSDAAVVVMPRNMALSAPVHLLFIATQTGVVTSPRCLVVAESGSLMTVVEDYVVLDQPGRQEGVYFTNAVTEIALEDNARINHIRIQQEGSQAFHIANCAVSLGRASNYQSVSVTLGARISRYNLEVAMAEGAECAADGLTLIATNQLADTNTCIDHVQPHGVSRQLHKCIVGGSAHAVFNGQIVVRQGAQRTDSVQSNRNLLLSGKAHIDTKPQLEIFADDVKCAHGATIGQLDDDEVFYLKSRGLSDSAARSLLTYAFGAEIIALIPVASLKRRLETNVLEQTGGQL